MTRISQYRWIMIIGVVMLGLVLFFTIRLIFTPPAVKSPDHHRNGTSRITATPAQLTGTTRATSEPTQSRNTAKTGAQLLQLSSDPYTNSTSQHQTEVEPGSYAYGSTIVTAFQAGRFLDHGSSNIGWATSTDGGVTWQHGYLSGTTKFVGGPYDRISDPAVAYDAAHNTWMIASVVFLETSGGIIAPAVLVSLSTNGGTAWVNPVTIANARSIGGLDKDWITCDNSPTSHFYGHCYAEWDNYNSGYLIQMSMSKDGGRTWGSARPTADQAAGFSGYPLVQPDGTIIVPISNANQTAIMVFTSTDGGASWSSPRTITAVTSFSSNAYFRDAILLTPAVDSAGTVYLVWVDCRFEQDCHGNDLVMTTSTDGAAWSPIRRISIAPVDSSIDYYVSGLGADRDAPGHLGLAFYSYSADCSYNCELSLGFVSSLDGGHTWSAKTKLADPFPADWVAAGNNRVGDYITVSFSGGRAFPVFSVAAAPSGDHLNETMDTIEGGLQVG